MELYIFGGVILGSKKGNGFQVGFVEALENSNSALKKWVQFRGRFVGPKIDGILRN